MNTITTFKSGYAISPAVLQRMEEQERLMADPQSFDGALLTVQMEDAKEWMQNHLQQAMESRILDAIAMPIMMPS